MLCFPSIALLYLESTTIMYSIIYSLLMKHFYIWRSCFKRDFVGPLRQFLYKIRNIIHVTHFPFLSHRWNNRSGINRIACSQFVRATSSISEISLSTKFIELDFQIFTILSSIFKFFRDFQHVANDWKILRFY